MGVLDQLNILKNCKKYRVSLWQCPQFIFLLMGLIIIGSALLTYFISLKFMADPLIVAAIVLVLTGLLLVLDFIITRSFERLAELSLMRADFVSIVSHQLRSPLTNLKWAIEAIMPKNLDKIPEEQLKYLEILKENSNRMAELVSDLLTLSRLEEGQLPQIKENFSLVKIVQEIIKDFQVFAKARNIKIELIPERELPAVFADPYQLKQVIENLLDNALKYTQEKGKVKIDVFRQNKELFFKIEDTGMGIAKEEQKFVFKKFFRAENAKRQQPQGSGLGLFIAKLIIKRSGGKIGFESEENKGSTFWFTLPIKS